MLPALVVCPFLLEAHRGVALRRVGGQHRLPHAVELGHVQPSELQGAVESEDDEAHSVLVALCVPCGRRAAVCVVGA